MTTKNGKIKNFTSNFGPQHPASHGVSRSSTKPIFKLYLIPIVQRGIVELLNENGNWVDLKWRSIQSITIHSYDFYREIRAFGGTGELQLLMNICVGQRARGTCRPPFFLCFENRVNGEWKKRRRSSYRRYCYFVLRSVVDPIYFSTMAQEHACSSGIEILLNFEVPLRAQYICLLFPSTPFLWASEEREKLLKFHERVQGARIHTNMLTGNRIWKQHLVDINWCCHFTTSKGLGIQWLGTRGDLYDRYCICIEEMRQSVRIILCPISRSRIKLSMESLIHHFEPYKTHLNDNLVSFCLVIEVIVPTIVKLISHGSAHSQGLDSISKHHMPTNVITIIGTQDIVSGEVNKLEKVD
ncbi:hypothetical protein MKX03_021672 [Papaver bracteatum]|nr:hypothetical protein MKX03_021672 [Papaver bracteatum]